MIKSGKCQISLLGIIKEFPLGVRHVSARTSPASFDLHSLASALDRPFVVLLEQDGADEAADGGLVGEDADDIGATFDFAVEPLDGVGGVDFGAVFLGEAHKVPMAPTQQHRVVVSPRGAVAAMPSAFKPEVAPRARLLRAIHNNMIWTARVSHQ